jgi:hypothetical protein
MKELIERLTSICTQDNLREHQAEAIMEGIEAIEQLQKLNSVLKIANNTLFVRLNKARKKLEQATESFDGEISEGENF